MSIAALVARYLEAAARYDAIEHIAKISRWDRYQASIGIENAAEYVAATAAAIGLSSVTIDRFAADGDTHWWSFRSPRAWTPLTARIEFLSGASTIFAVDHQETPFSAATYSAPATDMVPLVWSPGEVSRCAGAVAVADAKSFRQPGFTAALETAGAAGFVTDAKCVRTAEGDEYPGRIELDQDTKLFGFSLTSSQLAAAKSLAARGGAARVTIAVDRSAAMPVVTGVLPGNSSTDEVWLTSHLCHPRPGANDNGSGVAGLLAVGALMHARSGAGRSASVRFIWGPEFLGMAAYLHRRAGRGLDPTPRAVVNLDMIGEDQKLCGCPFIVERSRDVNAMINPLAERVVEEVFTQTGNEHGTWRAGPFRGFSDHALFAGGDFASPAVQLCHAPDRFNHSAADTIDKVSPIEMQRSVAAAAALTELLARDEPPSAYRQVVADWCTRDLEAAQASAARFERTDGGAWGRRLVAATNARNAELVARCEGTTLPRKALRAGAEPAVKRRWSGPFNTRAMIAALPEQRRSQVQARAVGNKLVLSVLLNAALSIDGHKSWDEILATTSLLMRRPIDPITAELVRDALTLSGWVSIDHRRP